MKSLLGKAIASISLISLLSGCALYNRHRTSASEDLSFRVPYTQISTNANVIDDIEKLAKFYSGSAAVSSGNGECRVEILRTGLPKAEGWKTAATNADENKDRWVTSKECKELLYKICTGSDGD